MKVTYIIKFGIKFTYIITFGMKVTYKIKLWNEGHLHH